MQQSDIPQKFSVPWANAALAGNIQYPIPLAPQPAGRASLSEGYGPINFTPVAAGGIPPWGEDENGILYWVSAWARWVSAGGGVQLYDSSFQTTIGGYPKNAFVQSATTPGNFFLSTADNNVTNPDAAGAGWTNLSVYILKNAALTGTPTAPTATVNSSNTQVANTYYADRSATNAGNAAIAAAELWVSQNFLPLSGGTLTNTGSTTLGIDSTTVANRIIEISTNSVARWKIVGTNAAESGSNAGSNLAFQNYTDAGAFIGNVLIFNRATGVGVFSAIPQFPTITLGDNTTNGVNAQALNNAIAASGYSQRSFVRSAAGTYTFNVPLNVSAVFAKVCGGGGAGGGSLGGNPGGCGGAGGYTEGWITVTPGGTLTVTVGAGGVGTSGGNGGNGGTSSVGTLSATGGTGATGGSAGGSPGGIGGVGSGGEVNLFGGYGSDGTNGDGQGGASAFGGGVRAFNGPVLSAQCAPGGGGGGSYDPSNTRFGGNGRDGIVILRY